MAQLADQHEALVGIRPRRASCNSPSLGPVRPAPRGPSLRRPGPASPAPKPPERGGHRRQLDVGSLQQLLYPVGLPAALLDQAAPVAGQLPQFPLRPVRDEAGPQQTMLEQFCNPFSVFGICLAPGTVFMWAALTTMTPNSSSKRLYTGFQPRCFPSLRG